MNTTKKVLLLIISGFGLSDNHVGNAVHLANPDFLQKLFSERPFARLAAAGSAVGLPEGEPGNSESGHLTIGAGRTVEADSARISSAIADGSFFDNPPLIGFMQHLKAQGRALHLCGLLSDNGVHSRTAHLYALLKLAARYGLTRVFVHAFLDGRDSSGNCGLSAVRGLIEEMKKYGVGRIATLSGRYFAMDRDSHWDRQEKVFQALVSGVGNRAADPVEALESSYKALVTDEFILPVVIMDSGQPVGQVSGGDGLLAFNFRSDRMRQFIRMFTEAGFPHFPRPELSIRAASLVQYSEKFHFPAGFPLQPVDQGLGQTLAGSGIRQVRLAETEYFPHITYFFNGRIEAPFPEEERFLVPSPKVATFDLLPEMSAFGLGDLLMEKIQTGRNSFVLASLANCDMVGHSGNLDAAVKAVSTVDSVLSKVIPVAYNMGYDCLITSDHGIAEQMISPGSEPCHGHSNNPVPFSLLSRDHVEIRPEGCLSDVAPTVLDLLGLTMPAVMTGTSLLIRRK